MYEISKKDWEEVLARFEAKNKRIETLEKENAILKATEKTLLLKLDDTLNLLERKISKHKVLDILKIDELV